MSRTLWFVVPVHGRIELAAICLRQLARTCDELAEHEIEASAVIVADRTNLRDLRRQAGNLIGIPATGRPGRFAAIERRNDFLSMRFNDGIQLACDPRFNSRPADFVVPCGSDDWIDYRILLELPQNRTVFGFKRMSFVREDGKQITRSFVNYRGGCGIRIYPRALVKALGYRPADEDRRRGCDTSILFNVTRAVPELQVEHRDLHDRQIVDWKTAGANVNSYRGVSIHTREVQDDPFAELAGVFPERSIAEMRAHYRR